MIYGYARTSRKSQNIDRQIRNILQFAPDAIIMKESYTGTTQDRPVWRKLFQRLQPNDVLIFDSVSRMSRNAEEGFSEYEELYHRGVTLIFIKEPTINTEAYRSAEKDAVPMTGTEADCILAGVNEFLSVLRKKQFKLAFEQAQKEVDDLHERTKEGIKYLIASREHNYIYIYIVKSFCQFFQLITQSSYKGLLFCVKYSTIIAKRFTSRFRLYRVRGRIRPRRQNRANSFLVSGNRIDSGPGCKNLWRCGNSIPQRRTNCQHCGIPPSERVSRVVFGYSTFLLPQ